MDWWTRLWTQEAVKDGRELQSLALLFEKVYILGYWVTLNSIMAVLVIAERHTRIVTKHYSHKISSDPEERKNY